MATYKLSHLSDRTLLQSLTALVAKERVTTSEILAHIAEVDARKLYLPAGYPSMFAYCLGDLHLSEQAAFKRICAARTARRFPSIFAELAGGRLHLSAVVTLAPHLAEGTAQELLAAATHKTKAEIEQLLAHRFPRPDVPTSLEAIAPPKALAVERLSPEQAETSACQLSPGRVENPADQLSPGRVQTLTTQVPLERVAAQQPKVTPLAPQRFAMQLTIGQSTHDKLRYAQELLSHTNPSGDMAEVLDRALDALIHQLEKRKFAATSKPRRSRPASEGERHVPADVRRAVRERDGRRCTFVSETGRRCAARKFLEFDHVTEIARGGRATVEGIRLRCRAHNQYEAERAFGAEFMEHKREAARRSREDARRAAKGAARRKAEAQVTEAARAQAADLGTGT